jgi:hypothetical protein
MTRPLLAALALSLLLSGCATISRFNPFGWFGRAQRPAGGAAGGGGQPAAGGAGQPLMLERTSTGAIVRAEGLTPTQGWWAGELVPQTSLRPLDGVIVYKFRIAPPPAETRVSTPQSRLGDRGEHADAGPARRDPASRRGGRRQPADRLALSA